jgi:hypothetical protein
MAYPLMPKATALWLVENTSLTFEQIAQFCGLHLLEVQALADGEIGSGLAPFDPIFNNQLSWEEIKRCEADPQAHLQLREVEDVLEKKRAGKKYTPLSRRKERPNAIAWMLKNYPDVSDAALVRLLGTTKTTIEAIRNKTHRDSAHIKPQNPVTLGFCSQKDFEDAIHGSKSL